MARGKLRDFTERFRQLQQLMTRLRREREGLRSDYATGVV
eukprot:gene34752-16245_t